MEMPRGGCPLVNPRPLGLVAIPITIALGAASRMFPLGFALWDKSLGDVAYATLLGFIFVVAWPRARPLVVFALTATACFAIELLQLTNIPRRAPRFLGILLGDTFAWHDVVCYLVGAAFVVLVLLVHRRVNASQVPTFSAPPRAPVQRPAGRTRRRESPRSGARRRRWRGRS
jgi:hypothetical protein